MPQGAEQLHGAEHVKRYLETDGADGHRWREGTSILLLTTTGRKSGERRTSALIYQPYGENVYLVVASKGGADQPPLWFRNLQADPNVRVQVGADKFAARARTATPDEKPAMWRTMTEAWPYYDDYQKKTEREIPVVVLERA